MAEIDLENEQDPIKASYDVYIKPSISDGRQIYVLQFPNRDSKQRYSADNMSQPLKMRIKPDVGMVEIDVPVDPWVNYDRGKGIKWGEAVGKSAVMNGGGSHGLPGGFGIGGSAPGVGRGRGRAIGDDDMMQQRILNDWATGIQQQKVLLKQTLGGQAVPGETNSPQYMIGTFRNDELHLTPVDKIVQMRPQFHHIDAHSEMERLSKARDPTLGARMQEPRAVHLTVKSNIDGEEETTESMASRITAAQSEAWKNHKYVDEDTAEAWAEYQESMFVGNRLDQSSTEVLKALPRLQSSLDDREYLDTISAPRNASKLSKKRIKKEKVDKGKQLDTDGDEEVEEVDEDNFSSLSDPPSDLEM